MTTTTNKTQAQPAHKSKAGFPLAACTRCGGSGHYSYNSVTGSRCFKCGGTGWQIAAGATKPWGEYLEAHRRFRQPTVANLVVGDAVRDCTSGGMFNAPRDETNPWREIVSIEATEEECGSSTRGDVRTVFVYHLVTFADGATEKWSANLVKERRGKFDAAPYLEAALKGWRKAGCKGGKA